MGRTHFEITENIKNRASLPGLDKLQLFSY